MAPKLLFERVLEKFRTFAKEVFDEIGEPRSLVLVVDWQVGQTDFPPGLLIVRDDATHPPILLEVAGQLTKMNKRVLELYGNTLAEAHEVNEALGAELAEKQKQLTQLQKEIEELEQRKQLNTDTPTN